MRLAAIDLGTNSFHLVVADVQPDGRRVIVEKQRSQVMLGSGGLGAHRIADDAFARGIEAMRSFRQAADSLGAMEVVASATSAVREASNGLDFCRAVKAETGIHVRVISGLDEARLIYLGAREGLDFGQGRTLICDLGGGSTEFVLADPTQMLHAQSLALGHIRLADRYHLSDPMTGAERQAMKRAIRHELDKLTSRVPPEAVGALVGSSGTIRCLARMAMARRGEAAVEHGEGLVLARRDLEALLTQLTTLSAERAAELPGMDPRRARTLPTGAMILREVMKAVGASRLTTTELSLRDGLLVDWILHHRPEIDLERRESDPRRRSVLLALQRFQVDEAHADHVADLSLRLFDATAPLHQLTYTDRELLGHAARLHDIGHHIAGKDHHKHGQYLLKHIRMIGFTAPEVALMANIVRYHSRSRPKVSHLEYAALSPVDQRRVRVLAGLLKIADALDRSHNQAVSGVEVRLTRARVHVVARCREGGELEHWDASQRTGLLELALGRPVVVDVRAAPEP